MPSASTTVILLSLAAAALVLALGWWLFIRYAAHPTGAGAPIACGFRGDHASAWSLGTVHYDGDYLEHNGPDTSSSLTRHRWRRCGMDLGYAEQLLVDPSEDGLPVGMNLAVACRYGETSFELAMTEEHYTALRSWVEAAPPGWNANVA